MNYPFDCNAQTLEKLCNSQRNFIGQFNQRYSFIKEFENRRKIFKSGKVPMMFLPQKAIKGINCGDLFRIKTLSTNETSL